MPYLNLYNPHNQSEQELIKGFVVRQNIFKRLFSMIKQAEMKNPEQHVLIQGQRGMGKTSLLLRLNYEVENDVELSAFLTPILFKEEAYHRINCLFKLWEEIINIYASKTETSFELRNIKDKYHTFGNQEDYENYCFDIFIKQLRKDCKKIVVFIDNLALLLNNFSERDSHRLREVLMTSSEIRIIGATAIIFESFFSYEHAFYEFFKIVPLKSLSKIETINLLKSLSKKFNKEKEVNSIIENQIERIETLRVLTGGVTRTIVLLFGILIEDKNHDVLNDLENILDSVTTLYQERLNDLSVEQKIIVDLLALTWDAISMNDISIKARLPIKKSIEITNDLEKLLIIRRVPTKTSISYYQIKERFFNIWYLMRLAPDREKDKIIWLVRFFSAWYNSKSKLRRRIRKHISLVQRGVFSPKEALILTEAFAGTGKLELEEEYELKKVTKEFLTKADKNLIKKLSKSDKELFELADKYYNPENENYQEDFEKALNHLLKIKNKNGLAYHRIGYIFHEWKNFEKAKYYYQYGITNKYPTSSNNLAIIYKDSEEYRKSEKLFIDAINLKKDYGSAVNNLGGLYEKWYGEKINEFIPDFRLSQVSRIGNDEDGVFYAYLYCYKKGFNRKADKLLNLILKNFSTVGLILSSYTLLQRNELKKVALKLVLKCIKKIEDKQDKIANLEVYRFLAGNILIWNNEFDKYIDWSHGKFNMKHNGAEKENTLFMLLVLSKNLYSLFEELIEGLKEKYKPIYYAYLRLIESEDYYKIPPEISQNVDELLGEILKMKIEY